MIVRIERLAIGGMERLYDLSDGSLSMEPIGKIGDRDVYSAEMLLCDIGEYNPGNSVPLIITGFTSDDVRYVEDDSHIFHMDKVKP